MIKTPLPIVLYSMGYYFEYRYENRLQELIIMTAQKAGLTEGETVYQALQQAREEWRAGRFRPFKKSRFKNRPDKSDKLTVGITLTHQLHEILFKMAVALRCSMAEMLRRALEMYTALILGEDEPRVIRLTKVLFEPVEKTIRIIGLNILDFPDHGLMHLGGKLDFKIKLVT